MDIYSFEACVKRLQSGIKFISDIFLMKIVFLTILRITLIHLHSIYA